MRLLLFILLVFVALTSIVSGLLLFIYPNGSYMGLSPALLSGTVFQTFKIPGIVLAVAVGGINLLAVIRNIQAHPQRYNWALAGAVVLAGWISVQVLIINTLHWLQFVYLFLALMILLLAFQLKGKWVV